MEKSLKKQLKRYIALALVALLVVFLAVMPMLAAKEKEDDGPVASILSGTVGLNDISTVVKGGGTLDRGRRPLPTKCYRILFLRSNGFATKKSETTYFNADI